MLPARGSISLRTLVGAIGLVMALLFAVFLPLLYATSEYLERAELLSFKAHLNAGRVSKYIYAHQDFWQYHGLRIAELIELPQGQSEPVRQRVLDAADKSIADSGEVLSRPILRRAAPIIINGTAVGRLEAEISLVPFLLTFSLITLASFALGLAAYLAFRVLPLRVLDRTLEELETQNTRFDAALDNMSQGLCIFDPGHCVVVCNQRYLEMYGLSPEHAKPGTPLRQLLEYRLARGSYPKGPAPREYVFDLIETLQRKSAWSKVTELGDGRFIAVENRPMPGGGWVATHGDITELRHREEDLRAQNLRFDTALNNMSQGLSMFDSEQRLVVCNERYARIYGIPAELTRPGTSMRVILEHRIDKGVYGGDLRENHALELLSANREQVPLTRVVELRDGRSIVVKRQPMVDGGWVATHEDITEQRRSEARIAHMAHHDALTDLPNRVLLRQRLEDALRDKERQVAVLWLDLDRFKEVNDTLGHGVGDCLLKAAAERLRDCIRAKDTVARLGGDEFAVIQTTADQPTGATSLAARIIETLSTPYQIDDHQVVISTSVGISVSPVDSTDPDQLLRNADLALYRAKGEGRGTYRFFEPGMDARMHARRRLELDLRKALTAGSFELHYQPIVDLDRNAVTAFEALLRWNHPERGRVPPAEFIPLAEETGLIASIGEWVLRAACAHAADWPGHIRVAVNLSPLQFNQHNIVQLVADALGASGLPASRLELEVTESVLLENTERTLATLHQMRDLGVRISMDDFGTGYSSLSNLRSFPFHKIKIDQSFIQGLGKDEQCFTIVQAVAGLGAGLCMTTTAEGVETRDQLDWVRVLGITEVQGFYREARWQDTRSRVIAAPNMGGGACRCPGCADTHCRENVIVAWRNDRRIDLGQHSICPGGSPLPTSRRTHSPAPRARSGRLPTMRRRWRGSPSTMPADHDDRSSRVGRFRHSSCRGIGAATFA